MKCLSGWIVCVLMALPCEAAEIVAWKVPVSRFAWSELENKGLVRCESAPEASPFFNEGDELWQLKKMPLDSQTRQPLSAEWVVWNANTGRLVAKGDWTQIYGLHEFLRADELPRHCRLTVRAFPVVDGTLPVSADSKPVAEVSLLSRSGMKSEARWSGDGNTMSVNSEVTIGEVNPIIDVRLLCTAKVTAQASMEINTALTIKAGETVWVARDFDGEKGLDFVVSGVIESLDGTPIREQVMLQNGEQTESLALGGNGPSIEPIRIGESGWLVRIWASTDVIMDCITSGNELNEDVDPFAESPSKKRTPLPKAASVKPPGFLQPWIHHEVLDAGKWFESLGLRKERVDDLIGYDPLTECLFVYSSSREFVEHFEGLLMRLDGDGPPHSVVTFAGIGQSRLTVRSGQRASLSRNAGEKDGTRCLEIEPTIGESGDIMDLRFFFDDRTDPARMIHLNSSVTLNIGEWSEVAAGKLGEGEKSPSRVKAEMFRTGP